MARITLEEFHERIGKISRGQFLRELHIMALDYAAQAESLSKAHAGLKLQTRSGRLKASISGRVRKGRGRTAVVLTAGGGPDEVKYARTHEQDGREGTTKTIKGSPWLTIPVHPSLKTRGGDQRYASARDVPGLSFHMPRGGGQPVLINWDTSEVWYILRRQVKIPSRPFMRPAMDEVEARWVPEVRALLQGVT